MKLIIIAGAAATGKTSVMLHTIKHLKRLKRSVAVVKIDCIKSEDEKLYKKIDVPVVTGLSEDLCPDHFLAINMQEMIAWAKRLGTDILILETAGLCNRCAPSTKQSFSICTVDALSSVRSPEKLGPMLSTADLILMTRGDMVSQSEREVLHYKLREINSRAKVIQTNGLTGTRSSRVATRILEAKELNELEVDTLRHTMPSATCSYCVGEVRIGCEYQQGIINKMTFGD